MTSVEKLAGMLTAISTIVASEFLGAGFERLPAGAGVDSGAQVIAIFWPESQ
jgi:hypothetical protein